jgi:hypothetical protein
LKAKNLNYKILIFVIIAVIGIVTFVLLRRNSVDIEGSAKPLVTQILQDQYGLNYECKDVTITKDKGDNTYDAKAELDNHSTIEINVEYYPRKNKIFVEIPYNQVLLLN